MKFIGNGWVKIAQKLMISIAVCSTNIAQAAETAYDLLIASRTCRDAYSQNISCTYSAGDSLQLEITSIGSVTTGIVFRKSDFYGGFYAAYGISHGCVVVNNAKDMRNPAFISPKNGKVYRSWKECANGG